MDAVFRAAAIYFVLLIVFRLAGMRTVAEITIFDFVLLLIIGEATQQAILGDDFSVVNAVLVIASLLTIDIVLSLIKRRSRLIGKFIDGEPMIIVEHGQILQGRISKARVSEGDIMEAARNAQGLERLDQIKFAILEKNGHISVIPKE
jgi:uncharacterized membrane protein YcaP (DUF421 family)